MKKIIKKCYHKFYQVLNNRYASESPIFIFGNYRGGTTLLQRILNSVRGVAIWGEQGYFLKHIAEGYFISLSLEQLRYNEKGYGIILRKFIKNPKHWSAWSNWYGIYKYKENFRKFIKSFYAPYFYGAKHWGFKEIRYGRDDRVLEFLKEIYPKCRMVFITRSPIDVISSQLACDINNITDKRSSLREFIEGWNERNKNFFDYYTRNRERSHVIRYEDLISDNLDEIKKLFVFLNFRLTDKQKRIMKLNEGRGATQIEIKKNILTLEEIKLIIEQTQDVRNIFGYVY